MKDTSNWPALGFRHDRVGGHFVETCKVQTADGGKTVGLYASRDASLTLVDGTRTFKWTEVDGVLHLTGDVSL